MRNILITVGAASLLFLASCADDGSSTADVSGETSTALDTASSSTAASSTTSSVTTTTATAAADVSGIVLISPDDDVIDVQVLDPDTGSVDALASFNVDEGTEGSADYMLSPEFDKLASDSVVGGETFAGYVDTDSTFHPMSPPSQDNTFGDSTESHAIGFDSLGNYYFDIETGNRITSDGWKIEYFMVPTGSTTSQLVATSDKSTADGVYNLEVSDAPDGKLNFTTDENCGNGFSEYFVGSGGQVMKIPAKVGNLYSGGCESGTGQRAITQEARGKDISNVIASPDRQTVVFDLTDNNMNRSLYRVAADGLSAPVLVEDGQVINDLPGDYRFYRWV